MIREIIFILVLFFITGCGMSGSKTEDNTKDVSLADSGLSNDLNSTDSGTQIAIVDSEDAILPQTFSIAFPSILKKDTKEENSSNTTSENNQTEESNNTVSNSNELENQGSSTSDINQTQEMNSTVSNGNEIEDSDDNVSNSNQAEDLNITILDNNTTFDTNQTEESNSTISEDNSTVVYCDDNRTQESNETIKNQDNIAYNSLKDKVEKIERVIKISQVNLTVLEESMPQILSTCDGIDFNTSCLFEEATLSVAMDNETRVQISSIINEGNITFPDINESGVSLGEVIYKKYSDDTLYQYGLSHEMSSKENNSSKKELYTFKWSNNSEDTLTQYSYEDNATLSKVDIHYLTGEDKKELMHVTFINNDILLRKKEIMNLTLVKKGDENGSYSITSNSIEEFKDGNETNTSRFSSNGDISEDSSLLLFSGSVSSENNTTEEETTTTLQDNRVRCNPENSEELNIELYELNVTGGSLENGEYLIFPPDTVVTELSALEIYEKSIGSFTVNGDEIQGGIHGDSYEDLLDKLIIIRLTESQELTDMFKIVDIEDRPDLKLIKY
jgi:hypothetical protein